jgi:hypothetical protein
LSARKLQLTRETARYLSMATIEMGVLVPAERQNERLKGIVS